MDKKSRRLAWLLSALSLSAMKNMGPFIEPRSYCNTHTKCACGRNLFARSECASGECATCHNRPQSA